MSAADLFEELVRAYQALPKKDTGSIRNLRKVYSARLRKEEPQLIFELARKLLTKPEFAYRFMAYELIAHHKEAMKSVAPEELEWLRHGVDSWYATDTFAPYLAGPAWRENQVSDELILKWAHDPDMWMRRTAIVCTIGLNNRARGGRGDATRTLLVCRELVDDHADMVEKAMSWALRELTKHNPAAVERFVDEHRSRLGARIKREVANKLRTGLKSGKQR
jgi:3-methyladenine DNA glycosylase AlkD